MRVLTLTTLYPNAAAPAHGVFVENRLAAFAAHSGSEVKIIAPVPWFPFTHAWFGKYAEFARAPACENRSGLEVLHPHYAIPPKVGMTYAAHALEKCFYKAARALIDAGWDFDIIDAHYLYPDGVAAVRAARRLGKPVVITGRGTDISLIPQFPRQRKMILEAARGADHVVTVAAALKDELVRLGAPAGKISVMRNGVDLARFRPLDREAIRREMALRGPVIASVGHLIERKGHHLAIEALKALPDATLMIAGEGEQRSSLEALAKSAGVEARTRFLGALPHERLAEIYNAADVLVVLLEAMACGTPVVATEIWGSGEVVRAPEAGLLCAERSAPAIAACLKEVLTADINRAATRQYAEAFSWDETSEKMDKLFTGIIARRQRGQEAQIAPQPVSADKPKLIITVDTEEAFDWTRFDPRDHRVAHPEDIDRFQQLAREFGAAPLYFLTYPLLNDSATTAYFRTLADKNEADLGLHPHQWNTPPVDAVGDEGAGVHGGGYYSYQCNLPLELQAAKLKTLADAFETAFGFRATAHRAGRYGVDPGAYEALGRAGVRFDFSPSPGFDASHDGGPDFSGMSNRPFKVTRPRTPAIFVTPVCGGRALLKSHRFLPQGEGRFGFDAGHFKTPSAITASVRLSCEGYGFGDIKALTKTLIAQGTPILTFSLHSTSLTAGGSPYAPNPAAVEAALAFTRRYLTFFRDEIGGEIIDLARLADLYGAADALREIQPKKTVNLNHPLKAQA